MKALIIIPAYNEANNILQVVKAVRREGYDYVVINDGSTDNTLQTCKDNGINVLDLPRNLGIGGAVQAGHKYAYYNGYDCDVQFDGDGQHDATYIADLLEGLRKGSDLVIGSRFVQSSDGFQSTFLRRVGIRWLSFLIRVIYKRRITDPTSGFRATGPKALELFCKTYPADYPEPESIAEALNHSLEVIEAPVSMNERLSGKSSIGAFSSIYYMIKVSLAILITSTRKKV